MINAIISSVLGVCMTGVIAWAFNLSNRVAVLEADKVSLKELFEQKFQELSRRLDNIDRKLDRDLT